MDGGLPIPCTRLALIRYAERAGLAATTRARIRPMRTLVVHNSYQQPGGEDAAVSIETALLEAHGHETLRLHADNDSIQGAWRSLRTAVQCVYSVPARRAMASAISDFRPDVVHVHNFFPLLTPSIYDACRDAHVPVVQTLHNYRIVCAAGNLLRDGRVCEQCLSRSAYGAVRHRCYRDSATATLPVAHMVETHRRRGTWHRKVDLFVALSEFAMAKFVQAGLPKSRIAVKPNGLAADPPWRPLHGDATSAVYAGRLSEEKGIDTLVEAWRELAVPLRVLGSGPMAPALRSLQNPHVSVLGHRPSNAVATELGEAMFVVMPSICYENLPLTLIESFAHARAVVASRIGSLAERVEHGRTGLLFEPGDAVGLANTVRWAADHPDEMRAMGLRAREVFEREYTPEANYRRLMAIYELATERRN